MTGVEPDEFDAAAAAALLDQQTRSASRALSVGLEWQLIAWGLAWGIGFLRIWFEVSGQLTYVGPGAISLATLTCCLCLALVVTAVAIRRGTRGIGGRSLRQGSILNLGWAVGILGSLLIAGGLSRAAGPSAAGVAFVALPVLASAVMFLASAAVWDDRLQAGLGVCLGVVASVAGGCGPVVAPLVAGAAGGAVLVVFAAAAAFRSRRG